MPFWPFSPSDAGGRAIPNATAVARPEAGWLRAQSSAFFNRAAAASALASPTTAQNSTYASARTTLILASPPAGYGRIGARSGCSPLRLKRSPISISSLRSIRWPVIGTMNFDVNVGSTGDAVT